MVANFQVDKNPGRPAGRSFDYELYASGEVAGASVDARLASDSSGTPQSLRVEAYRYDPKGGLLGPLHATRIAAGDVEADGGTLAGRSGVGRGAMITNRPVTQAGRLLANARSAGRCRRVGTPSSTATASCSPSRVAARTGATNFRRSTCCTAIMISRSCFTARRGRSAARRIPIRSGPTASQPGKTYYWAAAIDQGHDLLEFGRNVTDPNTGWRWGVGVERGFDRKTSAAFTAQSMMIDGTRNTYLEMNLRRALGPALLELSAADLLGRGAAYRARAVGSAGQVRFDAETLWVTGGYQSDLIQPQVRGEARFGAETSLKLGLVTMPLRVEGRRELRRDGSSVNEWLLRGSVISPKISFTAEFGQMANDTTYGPPNDTGGLQLNLLANTRLGRLQLRGELRFRLSGPDKGFYSGSLIGELPISDRSDLRGQVQYVASEGTTDFSLGYIRDFKAFALRAEGRIASDGAIGFGLSLNASIGPNPVSGGVRVSRTKLARTGQTEVTVFLDDNGDGKLSPGEKSIPDVAVEAGLHSTDGTTDTKGRALIEGMKPDVPVLVSIDTGSLPDPYLQPVGKGIVVTPRPGVTAAIELPLSATGEIEGTIHDLAGSPRSGVEIELVDAQGSVAATTVTEYDGYFLFEKVPYGRYTLRLSPGSAKALSAARGLASSVRLSHDKDLQRLGIVRVKPDGIAKRGRDAGGAGAKESSS